MFIILDKIDLADHITEIVLEAPQIAKAAKPGHFVLVRGDEHGERIPLTIADSDAEAGTITLVVQQVGKSTQELCAYTPGNAYLDVVGPLGKARDTHGPGLRICCVSGGLGVAPMFPQTKANHLAGNHVTSIVGARNKSLFFWHDRLAAVSDALHFTTDDGSFGRQGFATQVLAELVEAGEHFDEVIAIGPVPHMKAVTNYCKSQGIPVVVSLNPVMVDGTGMCGGCRVLINNKSQYACVDGPEFDGAAVDFDDLMNRQRAYRAMEAQALQGEPSETEDEHACRIGLSRPVVHDGHHAEGVFPDFEQFSVAFVSEFLEDVVRRTTTFEEVNRGLMAAEAQVEAARCIQCGVPTCVQGCPVEVDIPGFVGAVAQGDFMKAAEVLKDKNSLPAICGRVCPQETQCEARCVVAKTSRAVRIGRIERFVADWEAEHVVADIVETPRNGARVAVIGSGPGGLTCAGDLAKMGYDVTIFEAFHDTGGVLRYGIPEFRLPKTIVSREVEYVRQLGVRIEVNAVIGKVQTIEDLMREGYGAVFIGVGAGAPAFLGIPGENLIGVFSANEFLTRVNLMKAYRSDYDTPVIVGEQVAVIGAGNVAMDAARTAVRLGAKRVNIVYRRSAAEMPARAEEIENAREEGVRFLLLTNPVRIISSADGKVQGMECTRMELGEPDASGRRRPVLIPGSEFVVDCDMVIPALGSLANPLLTSATQGIRLNKWGNIEADPVTGATNLPGVYAGGDIVTGAATVIEAMGAGKRSARAIDAYLRTRQPASVTRAHAG